MNSLLALKGFWQHDSIEAKDQVKLDLANIHLQNWYRSIFNYITIRLFEIGDTQYSCNYCCILLLYSTHIQHIILQNHVQYISKFISARDLNTSLNIKIINEYVEFDILISPYLKGICQWPALGMLQNKNGFWHRERTTNNIRRKKNR